MANGRIHDPFSEGICTRKLHPGRHPSSARGRRQPDPSGSGSDRDCRRAGLRVERAPADAFRRPSVRSARAPAQRPPARPEARCASPARAHIPAPFRSSRSRQVRPR